ncbi:MAG: B12-binding domain-containing radical SAM protein [Candidatus Omnitrophica bacterium]|nr:B12-binding domain-containing radical SAM protein [Candidatus Omnitrophota bacterium]
MKFLGIKLSPDKKILLVMPPPFWPKMPPIGIGYLEAFLADNNINCGILDLNNIFYNLASDELKKSWLVSCNTFLEENIFSLMQKNHPEEFKSLMAKMLRYEIIGFSCFKSNMHTTMKLAKLLKSRNKNIRIIFGGPEMTREYFKKSCKIKGAADFTVVGEGEKPLLDLVQPVPPTQRDRCYLFNEMDNLDQPAFPTYKGLDMDTYPRKNSVSILFSRGCVRKCRFCSERLLYKKFRVRPVKSVIEEIRYHKSKNKTGFFVFHDSLINGDLKKLEELCDEIIKNFGSINWEAQIAVRNDMSLELLEKMKKSGCYNLFVGLESGSARTLKNMNKGFTPLDAVRFFKKLNTRGLFFGVSIIIGYPGETETEFRESLDFIIKNKPLIPKIEQVNPFTYYDGISAGKKADKNAPKRLDIFIKEIKSHGFKYTNAFIGNLIEK